MASFAPSLNPRALSPRLWILGPWRDLALFILVPLWILPLVWWASTRFDFNIYGAIALALAGVGHHLPGFVRAYTDRALFRRFRARFIAAPLFLLATFAAFSLFHLHGLRVIVVLWGAWHGAMQVNGFLRIYDAKAGSSSALTARLDWAMCLAWFGAALLHSTSRVTSILLNFYSAGGTPVDPAAFGIFRAGWDILTGCVTLAFLVNAWRQARAGRPSSPLKFLTMASSFGFFWFAMVQVSEPILGLLLFEIFHDIQYNTLVWAYNRGRVDQRLGSGRLETFLFGPGVWRIALYTLLVLAYGVLGALTGYSTALVPHVLGPTLGSVNFWTGLFTVSAFLHFYFDGFIWQVRETEIRQGLGIEARKARKTEIKPEAHRPAWTPAWKWAFFVIPVALLAALEWRGKVPSELGQYRNVIQIAPENALLHYMTARLEKSEKEYPRAIEHYMQALALDPDLQPAHAELADIQAYQGWHDLALPHYFRAVELDSLDYATRGHLATALLRANRVAEALPHLLAAASRSPRDTNLIYLTGAALMHESRPAEAIPYLRRALELDPAQARAWSYLGVATRLRGDSAAAGEFYRRAVALDPANAWR